MDDETTTAAPPVGPNPLAEWSVRALLRFKQHVERGHDGVLDNDCHECITLVREGEFSAAQIRASRDTIFAKYGMGVDR